MSGGWQKTASVDLLVDCSISVSMTMWSAILGKLAFWDHGGTHF